MGRYCDNCYHWKDDGDGWGYCKNEGRTKKGSNSCDNWERK